MSIRYSFYDGPEGPLLLALDDDGNLVRLNFAHQQVRVEPEWVRDDAALDAWRTQLDGYFAGTRTVFDLPLRLYGTDFQVEVWEQLRRIPYGETISYGELAQRVDRPEAARAVGSANGQNPIAIVVPCHRVIGADGSLTGFGGGLDWKRWLLQREQPQGTLLDAETDLRVEAANADERDVVARLLELYAHDFSERNGADVGDDGTYGYRYLDAYWNDADRHPFLFRVDERLAGFALVRTGPPIDMAEFFVLRKYRRGGTGTDAARAVFARFPGAWQTREQWENTGAIEFWRRAIPVPFDEGETDEGPVQRFVIPAVAAGG